MELRNSNAEQKAFKSKGETELCVTGEQCQVR
jgi:hypothetical protein